MSRGMMDLTVILPNGRSVPVHIGPLSPAKEVVDMVYNDNSFSYYPFLIHDGHLLDLSLTLEYQGVQSGDTLVVHEHKAMKDSPSRNIDLTTFDEKVYSVMLEVLQIHDRFYESFESHKKAQIIYQKLYNSTISNESPHKSVTVIPDQKECASTDPLPMLEPEEQNELTDDDESDAYIVPFETIEEAGKFFAKHPWNEWTW